MTKPQAEILGVTLPEGDPDWDEFWQVVKGNGPCNRERIAHRKKTYDDGAWVREAAVAYARRSA